MNACVSRHLQPPFHGRNLEHILYHSKLRFTIREILAVAIPALFNSSHPMQPYIPRVLLRVIPPKYITHFVCLHTAYRIQDCPDTQETFAQPLTLSYHGVSKMPVDLLR